MKELFEIIRLHKRLIVINISSRIIGTIFEGIGFSLFIPLLYSLSTGAFIWNEIKINSAIDRLFALFINIPENQRIYILFTALLISFLVKNILAYIANFSEIKLRYSARFYLRDKVFQKYMKLPYRQILDSAHGKLIHILYEEVDPASEYIYSLLSILGRLINIIVLVFIMILISWKLTIVIGSLFLILFVVVNNISSIVKRISNKVPISGREEFSFCSSVLQGTRQALIFIAQYRLVAEYKKLVINSMKRMLDVARIGSLIQPLVEISTIFMVLLFILIIIVFNIIDYKVQAPIIITFIGILGRLLPVINILSSNYVATKSLIHNLKYISNLLEQPEANVSSGHVINSFKDRIIFKDVYFSYKPDTPVLNNINITFLKNKTTAIVGHSGSGKSTIVDLLVGLFESSQGSILIDRIDIKNLNLNSWRSKIGYVTQDTFLFHGSVKNNISFANVNASNKDIIEAAIQADAHEFIQKFPDGYNTIVGERGLKLSGGQRQRIAIARALIIKPEILIFDEATSSLDSKSENNIQQAIKKVSQNRTVIIIAHRLSTVLDADKIIVLDEGRVVDEGKHSELLTRCEIYRDLYQLQNNTK